MSVGWDDDPAVAAWPGLPQLPGNCRADACVVGLGASGLAAVEQLAARGLRVVGVDAGRVAGAAAGRNGGFLLGGPEPPLHTALERWGPPALQLYRDTVAELERLAALLGPDVVRRVGSIRLAGLPDAGDPAELIDIQAQAAALRANGIAVENYAGPLGDGIFVPGDAATNPAVRALALAGAAAPSATLYERTRVLDVAAGRVRTAAGVITAPVIVVAVDGGLAELVPAVAGLVRTARLQMVATAPVTPGRLPCPVYGRWGFDYAQQLPSGRMFIGGGRDLFRDAEWAHSDVPTAPVQAYLDDVAARFAGQPVTITHRWAAPVGFTPDERPLCVQVAGGVFAVGGYSGTGNLVGPVVARAAVAWALEGTVPPAYCTTG